ncbi:MAG: carboxypeptidase-like regulatory domain-containing protein [Lentimicrobium sp.]|jgi:hypothetical protein|nr:carboxypeptidase-like regulatory domain-containing protein [Lentimicrobium sp.]
MRTRLQRIQKYKDLHTVLSSYPAAFEGKPEAMAMLDSLGALTNQLTEKVSGLTRPLTPVYRSKQELRDNFTTSFNRMCGLCIIIATRIGNEPMLAEMRQYRRQHRSVSDLSMYQMAVHVSGKLAEFPEESLNLGVSASDITAFTDLITNFGEIIGYTNLHLNSRRVGKHDLKQLLSQTSQLLINQCDNFVEVSRVDFPELFASYRSLRRKQSRRKAKEETGTADISGAVTNAATGEPVENASIGILEQETIYQTDEDGLYYLDELPSGTYTIRCYAVGYQVPETVTVKPSNGESLVVDFQLTPVNPVLN